MKKKRVAIVGFAPTFDQAPFDDLGVEIWSVNQLHQFIPRNDRIFQMHQRELVSGTYHGAIADDHIEYLKTCDKPVYMLEKHDDIPTSVRYPIESVTKAFGVPRNGDEKKRDGYFTNSISFMIALALLEGFEEIGIYGVDMAVGSEYTQQRPSCEYYVGVAMGMGIKVIIPAEADLLKTRFTYGYEDEKAEAWKAKLKKTINDMATRKGQAEQQIRAHQKVVDQYDGSITALKEIDLTWG